MHSHSDFDVLGDSGEVYLVNIEKETCTCMDWVMQTARMLPSDIEARIKPTYSCKHIDFTSSNPIPKEVINSYLDFMSKINRLK